MISERSSFPVIFTSILPSTTGRMVSIGLWAMMRFIVSLIPSLAINRFSHCENEKGRGSDLKTKINIKVLFLIVRAYDQGLNLWDVRMNSRYRQR